MIISSVLFFPISIGCGPFLWTKICGSYWESIAFLSRVGRGLEPCTTTIWERRPTSALCGWTPMRVHSLNQLNRGTLSVWHELKHKANKYNLTHDQCLGIDMQLFYAVCSTLLSYLLTGLSHRIMPLKNLNLINHFYCPVYLMSMKCPFSYAAVTPWCVYLRGVARMIIWTSPDTANTSFSYQ